MPTVIVLYAVYNINTYSVSYNYNGGEATNPSTYTVDFPVEVNKVGSIPSSFDLRNINGNSYITPLKNQASLDLCWDFTLVEQAESYVMLKNNTPYNASSLLFSTRQIDYASSTNGIKDYVNENGTRELGAGGNFLTSSLFILLETIILILLML